MTSKTLMFAFAIAIAQRYFAKLQIHTDSHQSKMAELMDHECALEAVLKAIGDDEYDDDDEDDDENSEDSNNTSHISAHQKLHQKLGHLLESFDGGPGFNKSIFSASALDLLKPLAAIAYKSPQEPPERETFRLLSSSFNFLPVIRRESIHWLESIYRRLSGKNRIRNPYFGEIRRDIPYEIFSIVTRIIRSVAVPEFSPPHCHYAKNKAAESARCKVVI